MQAIEMTRIFPFPLPRAVRALTDPRSWEEPGGEVTITGDAAAGYTLVVCHPFRAEDVPGTIARFLPADALLVQRLTLSPLAQNVTGNFAAEVPGAPVDVTARLTLGPEASGETPLVVHVQVVSSVPLFGSLVESSLAPQIEKLLTERFEKMRDL